MGGEQFPESSFSKTKKNFRNKETLSFNIILRLCNENESKREKLTRNRIDLGDRPLEITKNTERDTKQREVRVHLIDYMDTREREVAIGDWSDKEKSQLIRT